MGITRRQDGVLERLLGHDSPGEFIDRVQILRLKAERFSDPEKKQKARKRYEELDEIRQLLNVLVSGVSGAGKKLLDVEMRLWTANSTLWHLENEIRRLAPAVEDRPTYLPLLQRYLRVATGIHRWNDLRSQAKREIDKIFLWDRSELKGFGTDDQGDDDE